ncbi:MAG: type III secretion system export apparatus subunit SctT [Granulosicoccus sp.]|nr:type III secretion system export apparatus subunit SctT [Granulosicoccus sp.]
MELLEQYDVLSSQVLLLALSATRIAVAFLMLPLFSNELIPALVRNSIFLTLALIAVVVQPAIDVQVLDSAAWISLFAKEVMIGIVVGVFFGVYLWAFEAAGVLIDTQIGSSMAMIFDPLSGHEVTLFGEFLSLWVNYLFMAAGGLLLLNGAVLESYVLFPLNEPLDGLRMASVRLFEAEYSSFFTLMLMLASPIVVVIFAIDVCMGLINRYAQQLNVLFLSMSLKALAALLVLIILMPFLVDLLRDNIASHSNGIERYLNVILGSGQSG